MSLLIAVIVVYGFSQTIVQRLIRPEFPRPGLLYLHGLVFFTWVILFVGQTALIKARNVKWHRRLGSMGVVIGAAIPLVGIATSLAMARFNVLHGLRTADDAAAFLIVPINDMACFTGAFSLAIYWRRKPEFHRRLMLIATCCLTVAAFARFPFFGRFPLPTATVLRFYPGVDLLILLGVLRDVWADRRVHPVYVYGLPAVVSAQVSAMALYVLHAPVWMDIGRRLMD